VDAAWAQLDTGFRRCDGLAITGYHRCDAMTKLSFSDMFFFLFESSDLFTAIQAHIIPDFPTAKG